ncbi:MAG: hypothetical protein BWY72_01832 [Bacteroidetes bacterium ADurb.Bin416]|nr:MAG: hypothetical protein BWY72_01832 [Bacteroidetes bacterium ADurb.Bin416]
MVSQRDGSRLNDVQQPYLRFSFKKIEVGCPLYKVARFKDQDIGLLIPDSTAQGLPAKHASQIRVAGIVSRQWFELAVHIIGVQEYERGLSVETG